MRVPKTLLYKLIPLGVALGFVVTLFVWWSVVGRREPAVDFRLPSINGEWLSLNDFRGRPVVINFFLARCPDCNREVPHLNYLYETYRESHSLIVVGIGVGEGIEDFVSRNAVSYPVLRDAAMEVAQAYEVSRVPHTVFVDRQGRVAGVYDSPLAQDELEQAVWMLF